MSDYCNGRKLLHGATQPDALNAELMAINEELSATNQQLMAYEEELKHQYKELMEARESSEQAHRLLTNIIDFLPDATFVIDNAKNVIAWNRALEEMTGVAKEKVLGSQDYSCALYGKPRNVLIDYVISQQEKAKQDYPTDFRYFKEGVVHNEGHMPGIYGGKGAYLSVLAGPIYNDHGQLIGAIESMRDITEQITHREDALKNEILLRQITNTMSDMILVVDVAGTITYASPSSQKKLGYAANYILGNHLTDLVNIEDQSIVRQVQRVIGERNAVEGIVFRAKHSNGKTVWLEINGNAIISDVGLFIGGVLGCRDVSDRIELEKQAAHMALHDQLTEVHNRDHFENRLERLQDKHPCVGIITCDIDGLKIVNDTFGHNAGDIQLKATTQILRQCIGSTGPISRTGGDEFAIVLDCTTTEEMEGICGCISCAVEQYNEVNPELPLSISTGYALRSSAVDSLNDVYRRADNSMYREKLHRRQSNRSALVVVLMKALEARDFITEGHADRLQALVSEMARHLGLSEQQISDLKLLAQFHDIGKVGIPDHILFKPSKLTPEEYDEMKTHCSIGHRIALSAPDLLPIADWVLKHHEWWNGHGYPLKLQRESIPLPCRILAIADAFDAMTSNRPYRSAMPMQAALEELKHGSGYQFDPRLVEVFVSMIKEKPFH